MGSRRIRWGTLAAVVVVAASVVGQGVAPVGAAGTTSALSTWNVKVLPVPATDVAYDAGRDVVLATVPGTHTSLGNELVELDPETGAIGRRVFVGSDPSTIALTDDGTAAFVGMRGTNRIARVDLATFTVTASFKTAADGFFGPSYVEDLEAVPGRNDTVAASLMKPGFSPRHEGVWVWKDGVALPDHTPGHTGANRIEFASSSTLYGYNNETTEFGFRKITVDAQGARTVDTGTSAIAGFGVDIEYADGRMYSTTGKVIDPATRVALASFSASGLIEVTTANNRITFLSGTTVSVFDTVTTAPLDSRSFPSIPGSASSLVATGTGFAVASVDGVTLLGPSVGGAAITLPAPPPSTIADLVAVNLGIQPAGLEYDPTRDIVYVSVPSTATSYANSVIGIDGETGEVVRNLFVGSEPGPMAISGDGSILYVGQRSIGRVASIVLATFTTGPSFFLGNASYSGVLTAEDIEVQPGTTSTLAISLANQCCSPRHEGVGIFDSGVRRTSSTPGHTGANRIEFGTTPAVLYGTNNETTGFEFYNMTVGASGVTVDRTTGYLIPGFGVDIERTGDRVYSSTGLVIDPEAAELVGKFSTGGYSWGHAVEVTPTNGRAFLANDAGLHEFLADKYTKVASRSFTFGDYPWAMVATSSGFAVAAGSRLFLLSRGDVVVPAPKITSISPTSGPDTGGTWVNVYGTGFTGATSVTFGGTPATSMTLYGDSQLAAYTPARSVGTVEVKVTAPGGTATAPTAFTYYSANTGGGGSPPPPPPPPPPSGTSSIALSRSTIDFGPQRVHTFDPDFEVVEVTNTSSAPVQLAFELLGDPAWDGATDCPADGRLAAGARCRVGFVFLPSAMRSYSGTFRVYGNSQVLSVQLFGSGTVGYFTATAPGGLRGFGDAWPSHDSVGVPLTQPIVGMATTPNGDGQWLVATDGGIFSFGDAEFFGSTGAIRLNKPIVGMASTPSGRGYWLVASDGGIFSFGDAEFFGSTGAMTLNKPIVGMAPTPSGRGYWLVASDGGIFSFGDAPFLGSTGAMTLNKPIVGMASTGGAGYWFVASDGGIFSFGDAKFYGSTGNMRLNQPIVGMAASPTARGYWFVAKDGGVFTFGDAAFLGAEPSTTPVVAMAGTAPVIPHDLFASGVRAASAGVGRSHGRIVAVDSLDRWRR